MSVQKKKKNTAAAAAAASARARVVSAAEKDDRFSQPHLRHLKCNPNECNEEKSDEKTVKRARQTDRQTLLHQYQQP